MEFFMCICPEVTRTKYSEGTMVVLLFNYMARSRSLCWSDCPRPLWAPWLQRAHQQYQSAALASRKRLSQIWCPKKRSRKSSCGLEAYAGFDAGCVRADCMASQRPELSPTTRMSFKISRITIFILKDLPLRKMMINLKPLTSPVSPSKGYVCLLQRGGKPVGVLA